MGIFRGLGRSLCMLKCFLIIIFPNEIYYSMYIVFIKYNNEITEFKGILSLIYFALLYVAPLQNLAFAYMH